MGNSIHGVLGDAWQRFQEQCLWVVPHILASLLVLGIGILIAMAIRRLGNWLLVASRVDRRLARLGISSALETVGIRSTVGAIAGCAQWVVIFVAGMLALYSLDARLASDLAERFFLYLPHLCVALAIVAAGIFSSRFLGRSVLIAAVNGEMPGARVLAGATRAGVLLLTAAVASEHLGIGKVTLATAFAILFGGATLAAAIALGLGLQDVVRRWANLQSVDPVRPQEREPIQHW
jgi:hypothetical protein